MRQPELREMAQRVIARRFGLDLGESRGADVDRALSQAFPGQAPEVVLARMAALPLDAPETVELIRGLTIGETYFFRDVAVFHALQHEILTRLIAERRMAGIHSIRVWSAGCSTGEEPYSLAILLDRMLPDLQDWRISIQATDLNVHALDVARRGRYRVWSLRETPHAVRDIYFRLEGRDELELDPRIRALVTFSQLNLASIGDEGSGAPQGVDLILCRNVLMYLTRDVQQGVASHLAAALAPGGWLAVGGAEASVELFRSLRPADFQGAIFYQHAAGRRSEPAILLTSPAPAMHQPTMPEPALNDLPLVRLEDRLEVSSEERLPLTLAFGRIEGPADSGPSSGPDEQRDDLLARARAAADEGDLPRARESCEKALIADPLDIGAYLLLADVCRACGDRVGARAALQRAIFLAPDSAAAHFTLGTLLLKEGGSGDARRAFETAIRILEAADESSLVPGSDGMTAGAIVRMAEAILQSLEDPSARLAG